MSSSSSSLVVFHAFVFFSGIWAMAKLDRLRRYQYVWTDETTKDTRMSFG